MAGITIFTRRQSLGEEISNAVSHGVGAVFSLIGMIILIVLSIKNGSAAGLVSAIFYGTALIILYSVSTIYHSLTHPTAKKVFQILDHCSIFLLISGTYAPISLVNTVFSPRKVDNLSGCIPGVRNTTSASTPLR